MLHLKFTGDPPGLWICLNNEPIVSASEAWERAGRSLAPGMSQDEMASVVNAVWAERGLALYPPGTVLECNRCMAQWPSTDFVAGYTLGGKKARLVQFCRCPAGHLDTHWVVAR